MKKNILIIANAFPPYKHVGRLRVIQFAKYLERFNWHPLILTPTPYHLWEKNIETLKEIPQNTEVYRALMPPKPTILVTKIYKKLFKRNKTLKKNIKLSKKSNDSKSDITILHKIGKIFKNFIDKYILIPDQYIMWLLFSLPKAIHLISSRKIKIIYTCSPANSMHIIGYLLKKLTKKPWVADYRDLWSFDHSREWIGVFRTWLEKGIEEKILKEADRIIVNSTPTAIEMQKHFPKISSQKYKVISNGFDLSSFKNMKLPSRKKERFKIIHTGQIKNCSQSQFPQAVSELIKENKKLRDELLVKFYGDSSPKIIDDFLSSFDLRNPRKIIKFPGWVKYTESIRAQTQADVLLLILSSNIQNPQVVLHAKLFEYIFAERPILALVPDGAAQSLIEKTNTGIVVPPNNVKIIKKTIIKMYKKWKSNNLSIAPNWKEIKKYDRKNLTKKLANNLDIILQKHGR